MASTTRQIANTLLRQQQKSIVFNVCQRSLHSSAMRLQTGTRNEPTKKNFAESLTDKFIGQVWKQRQQYKDHREPTRFVQIDALPHTATTEDVYKLAREAFPKGDKNIVEMIFCRNNEFHFFGRCVVLMSSAEDARRLLEYAHRRTLGGNILKANYIGDNKNNNVNDVMSAFRRSELTSMTDAINASGRSVIITGLPSRTRPEHLLGYLRSRNFFPVEGAPDNVLQLKTKEQSTVSKFLVKFDSESEAWRCVRSFHNTDFILNNRPETYKLQLSVAY